MASSSHGLATRALIKAAEISVDIVIIGGVVAFLPFYATVKLGIKCQKKLKHFSRQGDRVYLASETFHPLPLPLTRHYNLSNEALPLVQQPVESRLMMLPFTVRRRIWEFAVGGYEIDIKHNKTRINSASTHPMPPNTGVFCSCSCYWRCACCTCPTDSYYTPLKSEVYQLTRQLRVSHAHGICCKLSIALLTTCRQIYQECMPVLYGYNEFRLSLASTTTFWIQSVRRQHMAQVKFLKLDFTFGGTDDSFLREWRKACFCMITWCKNLQELSLDFKLAQNWSVEERQFLDCLKPLSGLKIFKLTISYCREIGSTAEVRAYREVIRRMVMRPRGEPWQNHVPMRLRLRAGMHD